MMFEASASDERRALLMVWTDIPAALEVDFNDWYDREHMRERVELPGFIRGRRFEAVSANPKYLVVYEVESADVLFSEPYLRLKQNRDARSLRFVPAFTNTIKATCDIVAHAGTGEGGWLAVLPLSLEAGKAETFRRWISESFCAEIVQCPGIQTATYASGNERARKRSAPHDMRSTDRHMEDVVMIEASSEHGMTTALSRLNDAVLAGKGARAQLMNGPCVFRMIYSLRSLKHVARPGQQ